MIVRSALKALVAGNPVGDVVEEVPEPPPSSPPLHLPRLLPFPARPLPGRVGA
ncbi:hypothetical protein ACN28S_07020 [Cystobacter fuscus]